MGKHESVPLPLSDIRVDGHRFLTAQQIADDGEVEAFVRRFPLCFAPHPVLDLMLFYPDGDAPKREVA
jgi:hypothetical protein